MFTEYYSDDHIKKNELGGARGTDGGKEKFIHGFDLKAEGKSPLGRYRFIWKNCIKIDLQKVGRRA